MKIYKVVRKEITHQYIFVQANNKDHATEIANEVDGEGWRDGGYECNLLAPVIGTPEEMEGHYIETEDDSFIYKATK